MTDRRDIIEMKGEPGDEGEIFYSAAPPQGPPPPPRVNFIAKVLGAAVGVAIFLALLFFFVYIVLPVVAVLILWAVLRNAFRPRR